MRWEGRATKRTASKPNSDETLLFLGHQGMLRASSGCTQVPDIPLSLPLARALGGAPPNPVVVAIRCREVDQGYPLGPWLWVGGGSDKGPYDVRASHPILGVPYPECPNGRNPLWVENARKKQVSCRKGAKMVPPGGNLRGILDFLLLGFGEGDGC